MCATSARCWRSCMSCVPRSSLNLLTWTSNCARRSISDDARSLAAMARWRSCSCSGSSSSASPTSALRPVDNRTEPLLFWRCWGYLLHVHQRHHERACARGEFRRQRLCIAHAEIAADLSRSGDLALDDRRLDDLVIQRDRQVIADIGGGVVGEVVLRAVFEGKVYYWLAARYVGRRAYFILVEIFAAEE